MYHFKEKLQSILSVLFEQSSFYIGWDIVKYAANTRKLVLAQKLDLRATCCHRKSLTETRWQEIYMCVHVILFAYGREFCSLKYLKFAETSIL